MENMNNQGKRKQQYEDSVKFAYFGFIGSGLCFISIWVILCLESCGVI